MQHTSTSAPARVGGASARPVPASVLAAVRAVPGVAAADGQASGTAVLLGRDGKAAAGARSAWRSSWPAAPAVPGRVHRPHGTASGAPAQVMIDRRPPGRALHRSAISVEASDRRARAAVHDQRDHRLRVGAASIAGGSMAIFSRRDAQRLFGKTGEYDQIAVKAAPGCRPPRCATGSPRCCRPACRRSPPPAAAANEARATEQPAVHPDRLLPRVRRDRAVRRRVRDLEHLLHHGRPADPRAGAAARPGRRPWPGVRLGAGRGALVGVVASALGVALGLGLARGLAALLSSFGVSLPLSDAVGALARAAHLARCRDRGDARRIARARRKGDPGAPVAALRSAALATTGSLSVRRFVAGAVLLGGGLTLLLAGGTGDSSRSRGRRAGAASSG